MHKVALILLVALSVVLLSGCANTSDPTAVPVLPTATLVPTSTLTPTATLVPTETLSPTPTPFPTSMTPAPEDAFLQLGSKANLQGDSHNVAGSAMVAGLQTIVMRGFTYDGACEGADIRLGLADNFDEPAGVLMVLENRIYSDEILVLTVPNHVEIGTADFIAIYCPATSEVHGVGQFRN